MLSPMGRDLPHTPVSQISKLHLDSVPVRVTWSQLPSAESYDSLPDTDSDLDALRLEL